MQLIKKGKEVTLNGQTGNLPDFVIDPDVKCDGGVPCDNKLCEDVHANPTGRTDGLELV